MARYLTALLLVACAHSARLVAEESEFAPPARASGPASAPVPDDPAAEAVREISAIASLIDKDTDDCPAFMKDLEQKLDDDHDALQRVIDFNQSGTMPSLQDRMTLIAAEHRLQRQMRFCFRDPNERSLGVRLRLVMATTFAFSTSATAGCFAT